MGIVKFLKKRVDKKLTPVEVKLRNGLPLSWHEVSIADYQHLLMLHSVYSEDNMKLGAQLVAYFENEKYEALLKQDADLVLSKIKALAFTNREPATYLPNEIIIDGITYAIPHDIRGRNAEQFICLSGYMANWIDNLHYICAVLVMPKGESYHGETLEARAQLFKQHMSIGIAYPLATFFLQLYKAYVKVTLSYLIKTRAKRIAKIRRKRRLTGLLRSGAGWLRWMRISGRGTDGSTI